MHKMDIKDFGKIATCGVNGNEVVVSAYNYKCPCLNCLDCKGEKTRCQWKYVLETNPYTDDDIMVMVCNNCKKLTNEHLR